jgi:hypothetical protein
VIFVFVVDFAVFRTVDRRRTVADADVDPVQCPKSIHPIAPGHQGRGTHDEDQ